MTSPFAFCIYLNPGCPPRVSDRQSTLAGDVSPPKVNRTWAVKCIAHFHSVLLSLCSTQVQAWTRHTAGIFVTVSSLSLYLSLSLSLFLPPSAWRFSLRRASRKLRRGWLTHRVPFKGRREKGSCHPPRELLLGALTWVRPMGSDHMGPSPFSRLNPM